ncbi:MAG: hypothetical protein ACREUG_14785, partial [Steroidobacteraceae bacterium]
GAGSTVGNAFPVLPRRMVRPEDELRRHGNSSEGESQVGSGIDDVEVAAALSRDVQQVLASTGLPGSRYEATSERRSRRLEYPPLR